MTIPFSGSPIAGSIGTAAEFDCYRLTGNAGQTLVLELDETSGSLVGEMRLVRPNGNEICGPTTETQLSCKLDRSGTFTVLVGDSTQTLTGNYSIVLLP